MCSLQSEFILYNLIPEMNGYFYVKLHKFLSNSIALISYIREKKLKDFNSFVANVKLKSVSDMYILKEAVKD